MKRMSVLPIGEVMVRIPSTPVPFGSLRFPSVPFGSRCGSEAHMGHPHGFLMEKQHGLNWKTAWPSFLQKKRKLVDSQVPCESSST